MHKKMVRNRLVSGSKFAIDAAARASSLSDAQIIVGQCDLMLARGSYCNRTRIDESLAHFVRSKRCRPPRRQKSVSFVWHRTANELVMLTGRAGERFRRSKQSGVTQFAAGERSGLERVDERQKLSLDDQARQSTGCEGSGIDIDPVWSYLNFLGWGMTVNDGLTKVLARGQKLLSYPE